MLHNRPVKQLAGAIIGFALCVSSTAAGAAATPSPSISPLVALSAFGTPASASAVRPVMPVSNALTLPMAAAAVQGDPYEDGTGPGLLPALLVLGLFAVAVVIILSNDDDGEINLDFQGSPD
jgi:hypothetical protein